jgi:glycosyltransferase involved in cell wall biosynthesis
MVGLGDLWHLPAYFRWKAMLFSIKKYLFSYLKYLVSKSISKKLMLEMLNHCQKKGVFANHYAIWLKKQKRYRDVLYLRTPVHDPVGNKWLELRKKYGKQNKKHRILMIGDVTGTASKWGFRLLVNEVLPILENKYGLHGFEINIIGGGLIDNEFKILKELPYINIKGRINPPDKEFLGSDILFVPTPIDLGIRVRIITGFSYGACVVTHKANVKGIPEIIHGYNALVSESGYGLAQEVITALENNELRHILGENARKTYENYFSEEVAGGRIVKEVEAMAMNIKMEKHR